MVAITVAPETIPSIDPATGRVCASFESTLPQELPQLLMNARAAQAGWAKRSPEERCSHIVGLKKTNLAARNELAEAGGRESGKPRAGGLFPAGFISLATAHCFPGPRAHLSRP